jgi:hypothetical protein
MRTGGRGWGVRGCFAGAARVGWVKAHGGGWAGPRPGRTRCRPPSTRILQGVGWAGEQGARPGGGATRPLPPSPSLPPSPPPFTPRRAHTLVHPPLPLCAGRGVPGGGVLCAGRGGAVPHAALAVRGRGRVPLRRLQPPAARLLPGGDGGRTRCAGRPPLRAPPLRLRRRPPGCRQAAPPAPAPRARRARAAPPSPSSPSFRRRGAAAAAVGIDRLALLQV